MRPYVVRTGRSELYPFIPAELLEASAISAEHLEILRRLGPHQRDHRAADRPRRASSGALTLIHAESGRRYSEDDVAFLEAVADRVALALDTAITFEQQSERLAGVTAGRRGRAARDPGAAPGPRPVRSPCRPATSPRRPRRRSAATSTRWSAGPSSVRLLVGDVRGKGLAAVRTATVVLGEFRAAAAGAGDVAHVAREIDRRILPYLLDAEDFVTGVLVDIEHDGQLQRRLVRPPRAGAC